ncbi:MAG: YfhO family protein [Candidatus Levybacteria bacterium]|nr:YfhO family protein [Candidatus Levybacteria bacterium]
MRKFFSREIFSILLLIILILLPFIPVIFLGKTFIDTGMVYSDLTSFYYALKVWYQNQLLTGNFPFWTNLIGNGYPIFAEGEVGILYPLNLILYSFLPVTTAFNLNIIIHFLLAGISTYIFARISLHLPKKSSLLSAISFALSGFFFARLSYVHMIFAVSYFPLILFVIERLVSKQKLKFAFLLAIILSLQALAGHQEIFYYSVFLSFVFLILLLFLQSKLGGKRAFFMFFLSVFLVLLISSPQTLATLELVKYSQRSGGLGFESATSSVWPLNTLSLFINPRGFDEYKAAKEYHPSDPTTYSLPTVYGYVGILSFCFAIIASVFLIKKKNVFIFVFLTIFTFLWAQGRFSQFFAILWTLIPGMQFFRFPVKLLFSLELFLAILAGFGFDFILGKASYGKFIKTAGIIGIFVVFIAYLDLIYNNTRFQPTVSAKDWTSQPEVVKFLEKRLDARYFQIYSHGTNNMSDTSVKDFKLQKDFQNILPPNMNVAFGIPANREATALFIKRQQMLNADNTTLDLQQEVLRLPPRLKKSLAIQGAKFLLSDLPFDDQDLKLIKEIPFSKETEHRAFLKGVEGGVQTAKIKVDKTYVYENKNVYPRIQFVSRIKDLSGKDEEDVLNAVLDPNFNPTSEVVLEEQADFIGKTGDKNYSNIKIDEYLENSTKIRVSSKDSGFLVMTRTFYPGWIAYVDDKQSKIYRANYAFQAVEVPKGEHIVKFVFEPTNWRLGMILSISAFIFTLFGLGYTLLRNK